MPPRVVVSPLLSVIDASVAPRGPRDAFLRLWRRRGVFWLDSSLPRERDGQYSILGCEPAWTFASSGRRWRRSIGTAVVAQGEGDPLSVLEPLLESGRASAPDGTPDLPFLGGAVGWLGYELGQLLGRVGQRQSVDLQTDEIWLSWYDAALVWDHAVDCGWLVERDGPWGHAARERLVACLLEPATEPGFNACGGPVRSSLSRAAYLAGVEAVREGIASGEYYQLNLVQRLSCAHSGAPAATYLRLRSQNPAPFSAYIDGDGVSVLSSSPERFLELAPDGWVRTCPIKGTRRRGWDATEDLALMAELVSSEKERAELLMIVDLLRNDLGRVCRPGSIEVARLHDLETFATVHHLVGEIRGRLRPEVGLAALLRAVFPGGSITGAPKVSAMRAIARLEPVPRGVCMGSVGYFSAHGRADLNIAIRTIICRGDTAHLSVGAGIVADSDPAAEYEETLLKARALLQALGATEDKT